MLVIHDGNGFATNLYRKKTFTGLYTNFESLSPSKYKVNLVGSCHNRAFHICSSNAHFHGQLYNIKQFLQQTTSPNILSTNSLRNLLDGQYIPKIRTATVSKLTAIFFLPNIGQYSLRVKKKPCKFLGNMYPHVDFRDFFQSTKRIENLFPFSKGPPPSREEKEFLIFCLPFLGRYSLQVKNKLTRLFKQCYPTVKLKVSFNSPKRFHLILGLRIASLFSCAHL